MQHEQWNLFYSCKVRSRHYLYYFRPAFEVRLEEEEERSLFLCQTFVYSSLKKQTKKTQTCNFPNYYCEKTAVYIIFSIISRFAQ